MKSMPPRQIRTTVKEKAVTGNVYALLLMLLNLTIAAVFWWQLPPQIPLFYSLPYGTNQLSAKELFLILPALSVGVWGSYLGLVRLSVQSTIYLALMKGLFTLCLLLITIAMGHIIILML